MDLSVLIFGPRCQWEAFVNRTEPLARSEIPPLFHAKDFLSPPCLSPTVLGETKEMKKTSASLCDGSANSCLSSSSRAMPDGPSAPKLLLHAGSSKPEDAAACSHRRDRLASSKEWHKQVSLKKHKKNGLECAKTPHPAPHRCTALSQFRILPLQSCPSLLSCHLL